MLEFLLTVIVVGAIAGFVARAIVPGRDSMGLVATIVLGVVGAFIGSLVLSLLDSSAGRFEFSLMSLLGAIIGAVIALFVYKAATGRRGATL